MRAAMTIPALALASPCEAAIAVSPDTEHCYIRYQTPDADDGAEHCAGVGGYTVILDDLDEQLFVIDALEVAAAAAWIGLRRDGAGKWRWSDGQALSWESWAGGNPVTDPEADCVELDVGVGACASGCWANRACIDDDLRQAVCEVEP